MIKPQMPMHGAVSWTKRGQWSSRLKNMGRLGPDVIIITDYRMTDQNFDGSTAAAGGAVRQKYTHGKLINARTMRGGGCGSSDRTAEEINTEMMVESKGSSEIYRRLSKTGPTCIPEERHLLYNHGWPIVTAFCELPIWKRAEVSTERHQKAITISGRQRKQRDRPVDSMETKRKLKQVEERQNAREENRSQKGKVFMQEEPPFTVWEVEDNSDDDKIPEAVRDGRRYHKNAAEEGQEQTQTEQLNCRDSKVRRYGMRKRRSTPDEVEDAPEEDLGKRAVSDRRNPQKNLAEKTKQKARTDLPDYQEAGTRRFGLRKHSISPDSERDLPGKRGKGQREPVKEEGETSRRSGKGRKPRETVNLRVRRAEQAFLRHSHPAVRRIMDYLEEEALQNQSDDEMEELEFLLHDPGHTRGRMSLIKQSLHIYWVMKGLLAKAMEHVAKEMVELALGDQTIRRELSYLRIAMTKQEEQLDVIQQMLNRDHSGPEGAANKHTDGGID